MNIYIYIYTHTHTHTHSHDVLFRLNDESLEVDDRNPQMEWSSKWSLFAVSSFEEPLLQHIFILNRQDFVNIGYTCVRERTSGDSSSCLIGVLLQMNSLLSSTDYSAF